MFRPSPHFEHALKGQREHRAALREAASAVKSRAIAFAPHRTGAYRDWFVIVHEDGEVRLGNTDFGGHWVEWGSANNPPYAPLRRAVRAAGLRLEETPK